MKKLLAKIVDMRTGEGFRAFAMFAYFFSVIAAYYVVKPATRSLFIQNLGADKLPFVYILTALVIGVVVAGWDRLVDRYERHHLVLISSLFFMSCLLFFRGMFAMGVRWTPVGFYLFSDIFSVVSVTLFWSFTNDIFQPGEGKRLFGFIGGGGTLGSFLGSRIAASYAESLGTENLLFVAAALLSPTILLAYAVQRRVACETAAGAAGVGAGRSPASMPGSPASGDSGFALIRRSRYLTLMVAMMGLMLTTSLFIEQQFQRVLETAGLSKDAMTAFQASRDSWMSVIGFSLQMVFTGHILKSLGILPALLLLPVTNFCSSAAFVLVPTLAVIGWAKVLDGSLKYGINQATKEVLYLPTSRDVKYKAKAFIDMFWFRLVKGIAGVLMLLVTYVWPLTVVQLSFLSLACTAVWIGVVFGLRREYKVALATRVNEAFTAAGLSEPALPRLPGDGDLDTRLGRVKNALEEHPRTASEIGTEDVAAAFAAIAERAKAPELLRAYVLVTNGPSHDHPIALECLDNALAAESERSFLKRVAPALMGRGKVALAIS